MDAVLFDALLRHLSSSTSRRGVLAGGTGGLLASLPLGRVVSGAARKRKRRRQTRTKGKRRNQVLPPPPSPVTTADAACPAATPSGISGQIPAAQTFVALRGGQLTSASIVIIFCQEGVSFLLQIRDVDQSGTPRGVLASTTIAGVPATGSGVPRSITGAFAAPATVIAGQRYALFVVETTSLGSVLQTNQGNSCPDGNLFVDPDVNGASGSQANVDLVYATFVTA